MGLAVPISAQQLLNQRKIQPLAGLSKSPAPRNADGEQSLLLSPSQQTSTKKQPQLPVNAYNKPKQEQRKAVYRADQIMSTPVFTLDYKMSFRQVWTLFLQKRFRHFPVTDKENKLHGIISDRDILSQAAADNLHHKAPDKKHTIDTIMTRSVLTAAAHTSIQDLCRVMFNHHIGALPITGDRGDILGIITRSDILRSMIEHGPLELWI